MKAAIYARKSTDQVVADEAKSVNRQIDHARSFAVAKGWTVDDAHVFADDGISGAEFARRPGFLRLMNALKPRPPFQVLVMSEESRLGREAIETAYALKQLVAAGVRVFFYLEDRERTLDSPTDKILLSLTAFADELERERARQRTYDALQRKAKAGHVTGGRVFGYANREITDASGARSHVEREIVEAEAAVIRRIFELSAAGHGVKAIAKTLNDERAPSPRAQRGRSQTWAPSSVREVLYRDLHRGVITWNKSRKRDRWGIHRQAPRPESEWLEVPAPNLRIVSEDLWQRAHARIAAARQTYLRGTLGQTHGRPALGNPSRYLLTNLALCGCCGGPLHVRSRKGSEGERRFFLGCSGYHFRGRTVCTNRSDVPMEDAEAVLLEALLDDVLDESILSDAVDAALAIILGGETEEDPRPALDAEIGRVTLERDRLVAAIASGGALEALLSALKAREAEIAELEAKRSAVAPAQRSTALEAESVRRELCGLARRWRTVLGQDPENARPIVTALLDGRITITPTGRPKQWEMQGTGTLAGLFSGEIFHSMWRPHREPAPAGIRFMRQFRAA